MISHVNNIFVSEIEYSKYLRNARYIPGPTECDYGNNKFEIYNDSYNKASGCSFRCLNTKCRRKYSIRINSLFNLFPFVSLMVISEVIKTFLCIEFKCQRSI